MSDWTAERLEALPADTPGKRHSTATALYSRRSARSCPAVPRPVTRWVWPVRR